LTLTRAVCPGVRTAGSVVADARRNAGELEVIALIGRYAVTAVCRVTVLAALVDPTLWFPKLKAVGVMLICAATGLTPFPESETVVGYYGAVLLPFRHTPCPSTTVFRSLTLTRAVCPGVRTAGSVVADARRNAGELEVI